MVLKHSDFSLSPLINKTLKSYSIKVFNANLIYVEDRSCLFL
jgi:hypothetical protein